MDGLNGGSGWSGAWSVADTGNPPEFYSLTNLTYADANYINTGEPADDDEFSAGGDIGGSFSFQDGPAGNPPANTGLRSFGADTGTTWFSILMQSGGDDFNRFARMYINPTTSIDLTGNYFGLQGQGDGTNPQDHAVRANINGSDTDFGTAAKDVAHLFVAKLETDLSGINDQLTLWFNPTISAQSEAGLGTADFVSGDTADIWGSSISSIGLHNRQQQGGGFLDAVRISTSDGDFGVKEVLAVPEPRLYALGLGFLSLAVVVFRRSKTRK